MPYIVANRKIIQPVGLVEQAWRTSATPRMFNTIVEAGDYARSMADDYSEYEFAVFGQIGDPVRKKSAYAAVFR